MDAPPMPVAIGPYPSRFIPLVAYTDVEAMNTDTALTNTTASTAERLFFILFLLPFGHFLPPYFKVAILDNNFVRLFHICRCLSSIHISQVAPFLICFLPF